jgi:hypothetical protein
MLTPNVTAPALHDLFDAIEAEVVTNAPSLSGFVPASSSSWKAS